MTSRIHIFEKISRENALWACSMLFHQKLPDENNPLHFTRLNDWTRTNWVKFKSISPTFMLLNVLINRRIFFACWTKAKTRKHSLLFRYYLFICWHASTCQVAAPKDYEKIACWTNGKTRKHSLSFRRQASTCQVTAPKDYEKISILKKSV